MTGATNRTYLQDVGHDVPQPFNEAAPELGFEIVAHRGSEHVHIGRGERTFHYWLQNRSFAEGLITRACSKSGLTSEQQDLAKRTQACISNHYSLAVGAQWLEALQDGLLYESHPGLGKKVLMTSNGSLSQWKERIPDDATFEVELVGITDDEQWKSAVQVLEFAFGDPGVAKTVADLARLPFLGWASPWALDVPSGNGSGDVRGFDMRLASHRLESDEFCLRNVRAVYGDRWLVTFWGSPMGRVPTPLSGHMLLPGRGRTENSDQEVKGNGEERCTRLVRDVMWHNDWSGKTLEAEVDRWEASFYAASAQRHSRAQSKLAELSLLQRELGELGTAVSGLQVAVRTMQRRVDTLPKFPGDIREEIKQRCEEVNVRVCRATEDVREGFSLLTAVSSSEQASSAGRFQTALGALTALVLVPGVIISAYGANVDGLPGLGDESGLRYMIFAAMLAAAATLVVIWGSEWVLDRFSTRSAPADVPMPPYAPRARRETPEKIKMPDPDGPGAVTTRAQDS